MIFLVGFGFFVFVEGVNVFVNNFEMEILIWFFFKEIEGKVIVFINNGELMLIFIGNVNVKFNSYLGFIVLVSLVNGVMVSVVGGVFKYLDVGDIIIYIINYNGLDKIFVVGVGDMEILLVDILDCFDVIGCDCDVKIVIVEE